MKLGETNPNVGNHLTHLNALMANPLACEYGAEKAINAMAKSFMDFRPNKTRLSREDSERLKQVAHELATMLFNAQGRKPLCWAIVDGYPMAWNGPAAGGFNIDYIRYERGHDISTHEGGLVTPFNMLYESAQCNRSHGALSIATWVKFLNNPEITARYNAVLKLRASMDYIALAEELEY